jgi:hypothetical protein
MGGWKNYVRGSFMVCTVLQCTITVAECRMMAWTGCTSMYVYGKEGIVYKIVVGNHEGKRPL